MEFDETSRFWYPRVARDEWINFSSRTVEFRPSKSRENPFFCFFILSLSFSIRFLISPLFASLPLFLLFSPFLSFPYPPHFLLSLFVPISFFFSFSIFLFSLIFLISFFFLFLFPPFDTWLNVSHSQKCTT